jgi:hypothetical protein
MTKNMRAVMIFSLALFCAFAGLVGGWLLASNRTAERIDRVVAMQWGDGRYGRAFYGAQVYLVPVGKEYEVQARVLIGRGNDYFHELGNIGHVPTAAEAVAQFGKIEWRPDGLYIGDGQNFPVFLERSKLESHR